jgi:CubicO group peptidase (beta-lactamase class C family)
MRLVLLLTAALSAPQGPDPRFAAQVDSIAKAVLEATGVPSASVAIVQGGRLAYAQAYGAAQLQPRADAKPDMRYSIGSISKQFCAALVLLLQQDGKLSLDDKVGKYIPDLTRANDVTIRQLLSHTSGYQDYWPQDYVPPMMLDTVSAARIMTLWAKKPLDFEPGTHWQYSNTNYVIAGAIVEKVSGTPFFQLLQQRILMPLGMTSAQNIDAGRLTQPDPTGYMRYALGPLHPAPKEGRGWLFAAGELAMTPSDLAKWDIALMNESLLSPASYKLMETETLLANGTGTGYGLGVGVAMSGTHRLISHNGEVSGFTAENQVYPDDKMAIIVLTNQDAAGAGGQIAGRVATLVFANTTQGSGSDARTALARRIFEGLQQGTIDRSLFSSNANAYFSAEALRDFASSLAPLGAVTTFVNTGQSLRGGMLYRNYRVTLGQRTLRVWTFELPDGKLEQLQVSGG